MGGPQIAGLHVVDLKKRKFYQYRLGTCDI